MRALDSLDPQVHPDGPPDYLDPGRRAPARRRPRPRRRSAPRWTGVDAVVHLAAAVGVGQSMYEIERYVSVNTVGCAVLLEEVVARRDRVRRLLVASSMSIYGEGQHGDPATAAAVWRPACGPRRSSPARTGTCSTPDGRAAGARADRRGQAAAPDVGLRHHQARPRGALPRRRRGLRAARRSRCASSTSTAPARRSPTRTPAWPRSSPRACSTAARR